MDNWQTLKTIFEADQDSWQQELDALEVRYKLTIDKKEQEQLQASAALLSVYAGVLIHYLELMKQIEEGKIVIEEEVNGSGKETESLAN